MKACIRPYCEIIQTGTVFRFKSNHNKREGNVESRDLKKDLKIDAGGEDPEMWRPNAAHLLAAFQQTSIRDPASSANLYLGY